VFSVTKQNAGEDGDPAIVYRIGGATGAVTKNTNGTFTPVNFTATAQKVDGENTPVALTSGSTLNVYRNGSNSTSATSTNGTVSWGVTSGTTTIKVDLVVGSTIVDSETIPIVSDGTSPISFTLSNHAFNVACDNSGTPLANAFVGSGTDLKVFEGETPLNYAAGGANTGTFSVFANGGSTVGTNVTPGSAVQGGSHPYYYVQASDITAISADTGYITWTVAGKRLDGTSFPSFTVVQSFTKVRAGGPGGTGPNGLRTVQGYLYYEKSSSPSSAPAKPGTVTYNFSNGLISGTGIGTAVNTWTNEPRTHTATSANTHWAVRYYGTEASANASTISIPTGQISSAVKSTVFTGVVTFSGGTLTDGTTSTTPVEAAGISAAINTVTQTTTIDGGRITTGTINAQQLAISNNSAGSAGIFMDSTNNRIDIRDGSALRVRIGQL